MKVYFRRSELTSPICKSRVQFNLFSKKVGHLAFLEPFVQDSLPRQVPKTLTTRHNNANSNIISLFIFDVTQILTRKSNLIKLHTSRFLFWIQRLFYAHQENISHWEHFCINATMYLKKNKLIVIRKTENLF